MYKNMSRKLCAFDQKRKRINSQLGITPIIYGKEAKKLLKELRRLPTKKSQQNLEILNKMFDGKVKNK